MVNSTIDFEIGQRQLYHYYYLYFRHFSKEIQRALKTLNIKNEPNEEIQRQRMLLFMTARRTLHKSMTILGLKPLEKM